MDKDTVVDPFVANWVVVKVVKEVWVKYFLGVLETAESFGSVSNCWIEGSSPSYLLSLDLTKAWAYLKQND